MLVVVDVEEESVEGRVGEGGLAPQNSAASAGERREPWPLNSRSRGRNTDCR